MSRIWDTGVREAWTNTYPPGLARSGHSVRILSRYRVIAQDTLEGGLIKSPACFMLNRRRSVHYD